MIHKNRSIQGKLRRPFIDPVKLRGSIALEYVIISVFAAGLAVVAMGYIKSLVTERLKGIDEQLDGIDFGQ